MPAWHPIGTHLGTTADEARAIGNARMALAALAPYLAELEAHLEVARRCMAGQPRAASYDGPSQAPGASGPSDPTGTAALLRDSAAADLAAILRHLGTLAHTADALGRHLAAYPVRAAEVAEADGPGGAWCASCWRDDRHHEPVTLSPAGIAYYGGLCRWCGLFRATWGTLPPVAILRDRHQGRRISEAAIRSALAAQAGRKPTRARRVPRGPGAAPSAGGARQ